MRTNLKLYSPVFEYEMYLTKPTGITTKTTTESQESLRILTASLICNSQSGSPPVYHFYSHTTNTLTTLLTPDVWELSPRKQFSTTPTGYPTV